MSSLIRKASEEDIDQAFNSNGSVRRASEGEASIAKSTEIASGAWYEDPVMASRAFLDGMTFGFSDEIGAGVAAGIAKVTGAAGESSYTDVYKTMVQGLEDERSSYEESNLGASIGLNVAGAIATAPLSIAAKTVSTLGKAIPILANTGRGRAGALAAGVGLEGAVTGVGMAEQGEDIGEAALGGALTSIVSTTALKGLGKGVTALSRRRVDQSLGKGKDFVPITLADPEGGAGNFYRKTVGGLMFGNSALKQQESRWLEPLEEKAASLANNVSASKAVSSVMDSYKRASKSLQTQFDAAKRKASKGLKQEDIDVLKKEQDRLMTITSARTAKADEAVNNSERQFRQQAVKDSIPASARIKENAGILTGSPDMNTTMGRLRDIWRERGFEVVKNRSFRVPTNYVDRLAGELGTELDEFARFNGTQPLNAMELIKDVVASSVNRGRIDGNDLSSLRSRIGALTSSLGEDSTQAQTRHAMRYVVDDLNELIRTQLKPTDLAKFDGDIAAWKTMSSMSDAVVAASAKAGQRGAFTADNWLGALRQNQRKAFERGEGTLQGRANKLGDVSNRRDELITTIADQEKKRFSDFTELREGVLDTEIKQTAAELVSADASVATRLQGRMDAAQAAKEELKTARALMTGGSSSMSNLAAMALLGSGFAVGGLGGVAVPIGIAKFLSSQSGQRAIAGQTGLQEFVREIAAKAPSAIASNRAISTGAIANSGASPGTIDVLERSQGGSAKGRAAMYRKLESQGRLEELKQSSPDVFSVLEKGFRDSQQQ
jgi:hypothetical protein